MQRIMGCCFFHWVYSNSGFYVRAGWRGIGVGVATVVDVSHRASVADLVHFLSVFKPPEKLYNFVFLEPQMFFLCVYDQTILSFTEDLSG